LSPHTLPDSTPGHGGHGGHRGQGDHGGHGDDDDEEEHRQAEALLELEDDPHHTDDDPNAYFVDDDDRQGGGAYFADNRLLAMLHPLSQPAAVDAASPAFSASPSSPMTTIAFANSSNAAASQLQAACLAREFLLALVLCNTVIPQAPTQSNDGHTKGGRAKPSTRQSSSPHADLSANFPTTEDLVRLATDPSSCITDSDGALVYQAGSPDEAALVDGARRLGVVLRARQGNRVTISFLGKHDSFFLCIFCCIAEFSLHFYLY
jgi:hypothetical protein